MAMHLLIDGYNLMWAGNIVGRPGPGTSLARSREEVLAVLVRILEPHERARTTIVFDAADAPPHLERDYTYHGIRVLFSARGEWADDALAELAAECHHRRELLVVSSDHRVQIAARRAGAQAVDADRWLADRFRVAQHVKTPPTGTKPAAPSADEVAAWLAVFASDVCGETDESGESAKTGAGRGAADSPFPDALLAEADRLAEEDLLAEENELLDDDGILD